MSESRKSIVERNENTSVTCRDNTSSAISLRCNQGTFDGGATYRQYPTNQSRPPCIQRADVGSRRVSATMHKCTTCGRAFTRRPNLQRHASGCRSKPFVCDVCRRSFTRERNLDRHKRTVQCGGPPQPGPAPKRRRIVASLNEDPVLAVPVEHAANDELSSAIRDAVREN